MNQLVFLQNRNKHAGRHHSVNRILPPGQCLHAAQLLRHGPHDRLVIHANPAGLDGLVDIFQNVGAPLHGSFQFVVVIVPEPFSDGFPPQAVGRRLCLVSRRDHGLGRADVVDSRANAQVSVCRDLLQCPLQLLQDRHNMPGVGQKQEVILGDAAGEPDRAARLQYICKAAQHHIAFLIAVPAIVPFEMTEIQKYNLRLRRLTFRHRSEHFLCIPRKMVQAPKARQMILFRIGSCRNLSPVR